MQDIFENSFYVLSTKVLKERDTQDVEMNINITYDR